MYAIVHPASASSEKNVNQRHMRFPLPIFILTKRHLLSCRCSKYHNFANSGELAIDEIEMGLQQDKSLIAAVQDRGVASDIMLQK